MIYLISDGSYLKIGYAKDPKKRLNNIQTGNIKAELLRCKAGNLRDEKNLHKICEPWHVKREWFQNVPEVINAFDNYDSFSDEELQLLKNEVLRIEEEYNRTGEFQLYGDSCWNDIKQKLEETVVRDEWKPWVQSYENAILYDALIKTLKGSTTETFKSIQMFYKINQTIIKFPLDLFYEFSDSVEEETTKLRSQLNIINELKNDKEIVKSSISKDVIDKQIQEKERALDNALSITEFRADFVKRIFKVLKLWVEESHNESE